MYIHGLLLFNHTVYSVFTVVFFATCYTLHMVLDSCILSFSPWTVISLTIFQIITSGAFAAPENLLGSP